MTQHLSSASILNYDPESPSAFPSVVPIVEKPRPLNTLISSARRLTSNTLPRAAFRKNQDDWQEDAWEMFDLVGEQRFLASTIAGRMAQAHFYVGEYTDSDQSDMPEETADSMAAQVLRDVGTDATGLARLVERLAVNMFIAGDAWLVGIPSDIFDPDSPTPSVSDPTIFMSDLEWRTLSVSEVKFDNDGKVKLSIGLNGEAIEAPVDDLYLIRVWNPHPRFAWQANSPTRSSLPVLRELVGLTMHISAQVDSRLAGAGVFLVPNSAQQAIKNAAGLDDDDEDSDLFTESLMESMMTPISDRSSAAAVVPLVVTVPDDSVDKFRHMSFDTPLDGEARELRDEAIRRLALGQDAPPELLLGTGGMNHWGAWLVREDVVTTHLEPTLALISDALTTQYLRPVLSELGYSDEDVERFVIWYKVDHMIARPNKGSDAQLLHDKGVLSDKTLREANGFDDSDAPEEDEGKDEATIIRENAIEAALDLVRAAPTLAQSPGLADLVDSIEALYSGEATPDLEVESTEDVEQPAAPDAPPNTENEPAQPLEGEAP